MKYGLTEKTIENMRSVFARFPEIEKAVLYGSRAKGNFKTGSDIDLTLSGEALTPGLRSKIASALDDLMLPYTIDLSVFEELNHAKLREHIERVGVLFYERANQGPATKKGWQTRPFEGCIEKVTYTRKIQRKDFLDEGEFPIISQEDDFINGYWNNKSDLFKVQTPIVVFGDHTKVLKYVDFDFVLGADGVKILQPCGDLSPKFFYYQLHTANLESLGYARHYKLLKELEIAYPPLPEQRRIVGILDEAFDGIATAKANAEKNLQNARALFESHLQSVFTQRGEGWVEKRLDEIVDDDCSLSYGIVQPGDDQPDGLPIVRPTDLTSRIIPLAGLKRIDRKRADSYQRTKLLGGELLLCVRGSTGVVAIASPELAGANVTRGLVPIRFNKRSLNQRFGYFALSAPPAQDQIREKTYGTALMQINIRDLRNVTLKFPSLNEQGKIAANLDTLADETQRLESIYRRKLAALDELKKSLLHQAFSGEL